MKKEPVSISNGTLEGDEDPLRCFAPRDKNTNPSNSSEYEFKNAEKAHKILDVEKQRQVHKEKREIYLIRFKYRIWLFIGSLILEIPSLILMLIEKGGGDYGLNWSIGGFVSVIISNYLFFKMFFLGIGKNIKQQRCLKASRLILYVVVLGLQIILGCAYLLSEYCEDEEILGLYLIVALISWVLTLILAIFNKIQVNVHNQD